MTIRSSSSSGIPFGGTSGRPANASNGQPYFNGDIGRLELYTSATGWQNIVQETPGIASITGTYNESAGSGTFTISGTNFVSGGIAYAVGTNAVEYQASSTTYNSIVQMTAVFSNLSPAYEPYDVKVVNPSNLFGMLPDAFYINDSPVWSTTAGSLGSYNNGPVSIQLASTDDESQSITYSVSSGSLPTGLSLSSTGLISGTLDASPNTYSFTITASDGTNTPVSRAFSLQVLATITGGTITTSGLYTIHTFLGNGTLSSNVPLTADMMIIAGGGPGGGNLAGGGGAGGYQYLTSQSISSGSYNVVIGAGGAGVPGVQDAGRGSNGADTTFGNFAASIGGGAGGSGEPGALGHHNGNSGGSGGGQSGYTIGSSYTSTRSSATAGQGNVGGLSGRGGPGYPGAGGGGSAGQGNDVSSSTSRAGAGGAGTANSILGTTYYWAAGGGGGNYDHSGGAGNGGIGGAGGGGTNYNGGTVGSGGGSALNPGQDGFIRTNQAGSGAQGGGNAGANTGSGGGGSMHCFYVSGSGGSGIVVLRYLTSSV